MYEFFYTNYSKCSNQANQYFFSTWQGLANTCHFIQLFGVPMEVITAYVIVKKSPKVMKTIKAPLLNSHLWCSLSDFSIGALATPYYYIPSLAGFHVGILSDLGVPIPVQLVIMTFFLIGMGISIIYLFENRSSSILENRFRISKRSTRVFYYAVLYFLNYLVFLILLKSPRDQESSRKAILKTLTCPTSEFLELPAFVLLDDPFWIAILNFYIVPAIYINILANILFHAFCCVYYLYLFPSVSTSNQIKKLQRKFFLASVVQVSVPFLVVILPFGAGTLALLMGKFDQGFMNFLILVIGTHGLVQSFVIIAINKPYRNWVVFVCRGTKIGALYDSPMLQEIAEVAEINEMRQSQLVHI